MSFLVDSNILCESSRTDPEPRVLQWLAAPILLGESQAAPGFQTPHGVRRIETAARQPLNG